MEAELRLVVVVYARLMLYFVPIELCDVVLLLRKPHNKTSCQWLLNLPAFVEGTRLFLFGTVQKVVA